MPLIPIPGLIAPLPFVSQGHAYDLSLSLPKGGLRPGKSQIVLRVASDDKPATGLKPTATLSMPAMAMMTIAPPAVMPGDAAGEYRLALDFPHGGAYRLAVRVDGTLKTFDLDVKAADEMPGMDMSGMDMAGMMDMRGFLGPWSMAREGSGTSWLPDESPMFMKDLGTKGRYRLSYMGNFSLNYTDANVADGRGPRRFYSNSMPMLMARRDLGRGTLGLRVMGSLDPIFNGEFGAPNLFQTGETAYGKPLVDTQHPHDLVAEVSATYSHPLGKEARGFLYLAPIGEPALAGSMYLMRPSGMEIPEAPITHHWFDSSHITFGVVTAGVTLGDRLKLDASVFNGQEPDENRYAPDNLRLDSSSARLTFSPSRRVSLSASYGYLKSPESTSPDDEHRITVNANYGAGLRGGDALAATAYWGQNVGHGGRFDAYLAEGTLFHRDWTFYGRYENVAKDELAGVPEGDYRIQKLTFGATRDFAHRGGFDFGAGAYAGLYGVPSGLEPFYGKTPVSLGVYLRVRPSRMRHEAMSMPGMGHE